MASKAILLLIALFPVIILALHIAVSRTTLFFRPAFSRQLACVLSVFLGHLPVAVLFRHLALVCPGASSGLFPSVLYGLIVYNALGYCYFHIFNMSETARRIHILYEIKRAGSLEINKIESLYNERDILSSRIGRLYSTGQITGEGGYFKLRGRTLLVAAKAISLWGSVLGIPLDTPRLPEDLRKDI